MGHYIVPGALSPTAHTIEGSAGNDALVGGSLADTIIGGAGDDTIEGGGGGDVMTGGAGRDTFTFAAGGTDGDIITDFTQGEDVLDLTLFGMVDLGSLSIVDDGFGNAMVFLPSGDDVTLQGIAPTAVDIGDFRTLVGDGTFNNLLGSLGSDGIDGGAGDDVIDGGLGADAVFGGSGDDVLIWDSADSMIDGGAGIDTLRVIGGDVDLTSFAGALTNVEILDLLTDADVNAVTLTAQDVLDATSGNTLTITGDAFDSLNAGSGWTDAGVTDGGSQIFTQAVGGETARLLVDSGIVTNADILV